MVKKKLNIAIVTSKASNDDEGMKKIAINISKYLNKFNLSNNSLISTSKILFVLNKFDIIHFIGGPTYKTFFISKLCKILNKKVITIISFTNPFIHKNFESFIPLLAPDLCIATSNKWMKFLKKKKISAKLQNLSGVDTKKFKNIKLKEIRKIKKKFDLPINKKIILHVGHLKVERNISFFKKIQKNPRYHVVIVGSTITEQDAKLINDLKNSGCTLITKYLKNIEEIYQVSDLYIFPVLNEREAIQMPLSILEALSASVPVLSTNFGSINEFLGSKKNNISYFNKHEMNFPFKKINSIINSKSVNKKNYLEFDWKNIVFSLNKIYAKSLF